MRHKPSVAGAVRAARARPSTAGSCGSGGLQAVADRPCLGAGMRAYRVPVSAAGREHRGEGIRQLTARGGDRARHAFDIGRFARRRAFGLAKTSNHSHRLHRCLGG